MKHLIFLFLFFTTIVSFSQGNVHKVTKESEPADPAYTQAFWEVEKLDKEIREARSKIEKIRTSHSNNKEDIKRYIAHNLKVKTQWQSSGVDEKCQRINRIWSRFENYESKKRPCETAANKIKNINERIASAKKRLSEIEEDSKFTKGQNLLDELNNKQIEKLDEESKSLDYQLKQSEARLKKRKTKKRMSLDDFVESKKTNTTKAKSLDAFLTTSSSKSLKSDASSKKSKSLADQLGGIDNKGYTITKATIKTQNGLTGVLDSKGKTLIPFKNWRIKQYKLGVAEVEMPVNSRIICKKRITTNKVGFVDKSGGFIDGYEVEISTERLINYDGGPVLMLRKSPCNEYGVSHEKRQACIRLKEKLKRERERRQAKEKKERELKEKKCRLQINQYRQSEYNRY